MIRQLKSTKELFLIASIIYLSLNGCSTLTSSLNTQHWTGNYPLKDCVAAGDTQCSTTLFAKGANIAKRDPKDFPPHYLELYDEVIRRADCHYMRRPGSECENELKLVADYFNPGGKRPAKDQIGIALEGGGTKAASFGMGILAGLQELGLLQAQVGAISSISGGSYAASYYFNRWYDYFENRGIQSGSPDDWFRSCIPDYIISSHHFDALRNQAYQKSCWEKTHSPSHIAKQYNEFDQRYEYIGHVWKNHDLLRGDTPGGLRTPQDFGFTEVGNLGLLLGQTGLTVPFNLLARTVFRWPLNSAPSKLTYKLGLEREYGYSPKDWNAAGGSDLEHLVESLERRKSRTLQDLKRKLNAQGKGQQLPYWVLGTTAPGSIGVDHWLYPHSRDPLRQQFELTWDGYGSGTYGYASQPPDAPFDFLGRIPDGLPIVDAVTASAAFFDDDQTQISRQPFRLLAGAGQHLLNITWYTELRNFNKSFDDRLVAKILPWPTYFGLMDVEGKTPYIHLQDGGNTENSGILPLLRRGYKTIIYSHGTEDKNAEWTSICHLKNQLELDGTYYLVSPDFEKLMAAQTLPPLTPNGRKFNNHLDHLCSSQLNDSDLATFDENPEREDSERIPAVAKLYCGRLGYPVTARSLADPNYVPCPEFVQKFEEGDNIKVESKLFYNWHSDNKISFQLYRGNALSKTANPYLISNVIAIVPGISLNELMLQLVPEKGDNLVKTWDDWCSQAETWRKNRQIAYCYGPEDNLLAVPDKQQLKPGLGLACTALAEVLEDDCNNTFGKAQHQPNFPQNNLILQTLHTTYIEYAANFDLARHQVRQAICSSPDFPGHRPQKCTPKP